MPTPDEIAEHWEFKFQDLLDEVVIVSINEYRRHGKEATVKQIAFDFRCEEDDVTDSFERLEKGGRLPDV